LEPQGGSLEGFENAKQEELLLTVFLGGLEAVEKYLRAKLRSAEPFRTVLEVCRTVPNRSGDLCAKKIVT
jgi:hypothetical protein